MNEEHNASPDKRYLAETIYINGLPFDVTLPYFKSQNDLDPVPGNPQPGETIPVSPTMPEKGEDTTTTIPVTTVPVTTVPETTVPRATTTTPPKMPTIPVEIPTAPQETN